MPACHALICQSVRNSGSTADQAVNMVAKAARAAQNWSSQSMGAAYHPGLTTTAKGA